MLVSFVDEPLIDLIAEAQCVMFNTEVCNHLQLVSGEDLQEKQRNYRTRPSSQKTSDSMEMQHSRQWPRCVASDSVTPPCCLKAHTDTALSSWFGHFQPSKVRAGNSVPSLLCYDAFLYEMMIQLCAHLPNRIVGSVDDDGLRLGVEFTG